MEAFPYRRLVVIGVTGAGKSTLAKQLSEHLHLEYVELDALHWQPNWTPSPLPEFRERAQAVLSATDGWVVAGNYHVVRDLVWPKAEAIMWLDYSLPLVFRQLLVRTIRRSVLREELWNGNREKFWWHLKLWSDESLFHWLFKTYWRRKREYPLLLAQPEHAHLHPIRFSSPGETKNWLASL